MSPALLGKQFEVVEFKFVVQFLVFHGKVRVSDKSCDHSYEADADGLGVHGLDHSNEGKHNWNKVDLEGIKVSDVSNVEV